MRAEWARITIGPGQYSSTSTIHTSAPVKPLILMVLKSNVNKKYTTTAPRTDTRKARPDSKPKSPVERNMPLQYQIWRPIQFYSPAKRFLDFGGGMITQRREIPYGE